MYVHFLCLFYLKIQINLRTNITKLTVHIHNNLLNHPTFHSEDLYTVLVNLVSKSKRFVGLSSYQFMLSTVLLTSRNARYSRLLLVGFTKTKCQ